MKFTKSKTLFSLVVAIGCMLIGVHTLQAQQLTNLLANPGTNTDDSGWTYLYNDGPGTVVEAGAGYGGTAGLLTGFNTQIAQDIDLLAIGYSEAFLDGAPIIRFADWFKGTGTDVGDQYRFYIELRDANGDIIDNYASDWYIGTVDFQQVKHNMINYGPGLRSIYVTRQSWDAEYDESANLGSVLDAAYLSIGNHLLNANANTGDLSGWTIESEGGDGWNAREFGPGLYKYQTSYETCTKSQTIDLLELGYTEADLDMQPRIDVWEFYWGYDGGAGGAALEDTHFMNVELRDGSGNVIDAFQSGDLTCTADAQLLEATFSDYGAGLREIYVQHGGVDQEYWAGYYGGFIDATTVRLDFDDIAINVEETAQNNNQLSCSPNPVSVGETIQLSLDNSIQGTYNLIIRNMLGQDVFNTEIEKTTTDFTTNIAIPQHLTKGVYLLSVGQNDFIATKRLIIK